MSSPRLRQLEKARTQQWRPNAAKKKKKKTDIHKRGNLIEEAHVEIKFLGICITLEIWFLEILNIYIITKQNYVFKRKKSPKVEIKQMHFISSWWHTSTEDLFQVI